MERARGDPAGCTTAFPWKLIAAGGMGRQQRQDPAPAHQHRHRHPVVGRDVPGLPALWPDRDDQPVASGLVHDSARPGFTGRRDVAEYGERCPADRLPHLLAGQLWSGFALSVLDRLGRHGRPSRLSRSYQAATIELPPGGQQTVESSGQH
jgi:hypothetical protein